MSNTATTSPAAALDNPGPTSWRVLVVEDVPSQQKLLITILRKFGHTVVAADSGEKAIEVFQGQPFDVVLMDVRMPGIGGVEAARQISSRGLSAIVVLVTADELPCERRPGTAAEIVSKHRLSRTLLRRLWEDYGSQQSGLRG